MGLTTEQEALLPSDEDVAFYEEHGYYVSGKILPDEVIDAAVRGAERHWSGERDYAMPISSGYADWKPSDGDTIRNSEYTALQNREIRALAEYPLIGAIAGRLSRSNEIRLWDDQLVSKPASTGPSGPVVGWHTDRAYWMTCTSEDMLTAWVPLHDCPVEMGPVIYIDGSHKWPGTESLRHFNSQDLDELEARLGGEGSDVKKRVIALKKGQASFHHSRLIHGSDVNRGTFPRTSIALHMQDEKNRYQVYRNEAGEPWHIVNDDLCRKNGDGHPDYTDPAAFPVLFRADRA
jgi:Phytanoyl-CoA dioxygenase (PhyH)